MHNIKSWMTESWIEENYKEDVKDFIFKKFQLEDPVAKNNIDNSLLIDLTSMKLKKRLKAASGILSTLLNENDFIFCEYGVIGIDKKRRYIKGHPHKENCFEFKSQNDDLWYCYDNITCCRVDRNKFKFHKYIKDVIFKNNFWNNYYFINLHEKFAIRVYDERGLVIVSEQLDETKKKINSYARLFKS